MNDEVMINKEKYPLPITFVVNITVNDRTQLTLAMSFIYSFRGGVRTGGGSITFYKKVDVIQASPLSKPIISQNTLHREEIEDQHERLFEIKEYLFCSIGKMTDYEQQIIPLLNHLEQL